MVEQFCKSILQLKLNNPKSLANLVMGLSSQTHAHSAVSISESPCYHYQFSSISKAISGISIKKGGTSKRSQQDIEQMFLRVKKDYLSKPNEKFWLLNTDSSPLFRPYSPTLPNRGYVHKPNNQIKKNRPVEVGYEFSCVGLSSRMGLYGMSQPSWNLPLSMRLVPRQGNKNSFTANQVNELLENKELPFCKELTVNALDSGYSSPEYIEATYKQPHLVNIIRLASNRNVWHQLSDQEQSARRLSNADSRGTHAVYGNKHKLSEAKKWSLPCDETIEFGVKNGKDKAHTVKVQLWRNMMLRSKRGHNMKDKSCHLVGIELLKKDGSPSYKKTLWLSVWGEEKDKLNLEEIYWAYRHRFDIEHFFRFGKQKLLLDKLQTPIEENMENWLEVVSLAYFLLWAGQKDAKYDCPKWQTYDRNRKKRVKYDLMPSPSEVQRQLNRIILSFDQKPFLPKLQIKGKGRKEGTTFPKRKRFPVIFKGKKTGKQPET